MPNFHSDLFFFLSPGRRPLQPSEEEPVRGRAEGRGVQAARPQEGVPRGEPAAEAAPRPVEVPGGGGGKGAAGRGQGAAGAQAGGRGRRGGRD